MIQDFIILNNIMRDRNQNNFTELQIIKERVELTICTFLNLNDVLNTNNITELVTQFRLYSSMITREFRSVSSRPAVTVFKRCKVLTENKVRPKTYLAEDTLICLRETGYKWKDIAAMFMVSRWTLFQQAKELGLESITGFNNISDEELDLKMRDFKYLHGPAVGRSLAMGYLRECGLRGQQEWVAKALVRVEPENSPLRWAALIRRWKYSVLVPNNLRHADEHHSLISWGFVIEIRGNEEEFSLLHHQFKTRESNGYGEIFGMQFVVHSITYFKQWKFKVRGNSKRLTWKG